ncbi:hypothetical protein HG536_0H02190 [Torulaspora globosa]|uniref:DAGKc domain-containing protein n=1 Tax=Torulaspora globosa TaxID=48254 RepID=A0A7G3ZMV8_9SACH|nr:uncharacterized protein HG536_0H02190 [Torulaspora globosa]QLL34844.1 hypothetical protein HG536_0H02190 [Torulaspora globosa]
MRFENSRQASGRMESTKRTRLACIGDHEFYVVTRFVGPVRVSFELEAVPATTRSDVPPVATGELVVIDSTASGKGRTAQDDFYQIVIGPVFEKLNLHHTLIKTTSRDSISSYARTLDTGRSYTVMLLSGDTSISELINNLPQRFCGSELSVLPFPLGSGNAWASSLGFLDPAETLHSFLTGSLSSKHFPLYRAVFPNGYSIVFFIILSLGFHANMLHACEAPEYKRMGNERFREAGGRVLAQYDLDLGITAGGLTNSYSYFALINTPNLEPAYTPSPQSNPLRHELHVLAYSSSLGKDQLLASIMKGYRLKKGEELPKEAGTTYLPMTTDFDVKLNIDPEKAPRYKFEICCDGVLLNLLDLQSEDTVKNTIHIEFPHHYSGFNLKVLSPR